MNPNYLDSKDQLVLQLIKFARYFCIYFPTSANIKTQEYIPFGCVPPAAVAVSPAMHAPLPRMPLPCMPPPHMSPCPAMHAPPHHASPSAMHAPCHTCPPVDRQTPVKTLPLQTSFAGGINSCSRLKGDICVLKENAKISDLIRRNIYNVHVDIDTLFTDSRCSRSV